MRTTAAATLTVVERRQLWLTDYKNSNSSSSNTDSGIEKSSLFVTMKEIYECIYESAGSLWN